MTSQDVPREKWAWKFENVGPEWLFGLAVGRAELIFAFGPWYFGFERGA